MADPFFLNLEIYPDDWAVARTLLPRHEGDGVEWPFLISEMSEQEDDGSVYSDYGVPRVVVYEAYYEWVEALERLEAANVRFIAFESETYEGDVYRVNYEGVSYMIPALRGEGPAYPVDKNGMIRKNLREGARNAMRAMTKLERLLDKARKDASERISRTVR